jgi:hypothetical protein
LVKGDDVKAAVAALALICLSGAARAGVLSEADMQRMRDHEQIVVPADRETASLRAMASRLDALIAAAGRASGSVDGAGRVGVQSTLRDFPPIGGSALEMMVSSLRAIPDAHLFTARQWVALLIEVRAEIEERLNYDAEVLKAYQRSLAHGAPGLLDRSSDGTSGPPPRPIGPGSIRRSLARMNFDHRAGYRVSTAGEDVA